MAAGFDTRVTSSLKYRGTTKPLRRREQVDNITEFERLYSHIKVLQNGLSLYVKTHYDNFSGIDLNMKEADNRHNSQMNNLATVDHAKRDWIDDTDYMLPRAG